MKLDTRLIRHAGLNLDEYLDNLGSGGGGGGGGEVTILTGSPLEDSSIHGRDLTLENGSLVTEAASEAKWGQGVVGNRANNLGSAGMGGLLSGDLSMVLSCRVADINGGTQALISQGWADGVLFRTLPFILYIQGGVWKYGHTYPSGSNFYEAPNGGAATEGDHVFTLRRNEAARTIVIKMDGVEIINATWPSGQNPSFNSENHPVWINGYKHPDSGLNHIVAGATYSAHIWDKLVDQSVLDTLASNAGTDSALGDEFMYYTFEEGIVLPVVRVVYDTVTGTNGAFNVDIAAELGLSRIIHAEGIVLGSDVSPWPGALDGMTPFAVKNVGFFDVGTHASTFYPTDFLRGVAYNGDGSGFMGAGNPIRLMVTGIRIA